MKDPIQEFTINQISSKLKLQMKRLDLSHSFCKNGQYYDKKIWMDEVFQWVQYKVTLY